MNAFAIGNKLDNLSIQAKLVLLLLVPVLGLAFFAASGIWERVQVMRDMDATSQMIKLSVRTGALVHELQKERGLSSGYINARGGKFREELSRQRAMADAEFDKLAKAVAINPGAAAPVRKYLDNVATLREKLRGIRAGIDSLAIAGKESYAFYTSINQACLEVLASVARNSRQPDLMRAALSYYSFSSAREEMGKERATLNAVLAAGAFDDETYARIFLILASQNGHLERFRKFAPDDIVAAFDDAAQSDPFRKAEALRTLVMGKGRAGGFGVMPEAWFDTITAKIDLMKGIEGSLSQQILNQADALSVSARNALMLEIAMTLILAVLALILARTIVSGITRPLAVLVEAVRNIGQGNLDQAGHLNAAQRQDEIGILMQGFSRMVGQLRENLEQRQAAEARVRDTLDTTVRIVGEYQRFVAEVSGGDLRQRVKLAGDSTGTLGQLGADLNAMTGSLANVASGTSEAINAIHTALEQLQSAISAQSAGASEQAAAVNQTTSSLDEIKAMSVQTLDKVRVLGETAERSRRESEQGSEAVEQTIASMGAIRERVEGIAQTILALNEQTQQIGEITAVVANLAQQSKMLALNASIEAAKAGEAGKGFAVVAAEVRELAEQSQQSTAQVQKILQDIRHATDRAVMATEEGSKGVDGGVVSAQRSGEAMRQLNEVIRETALVSQQIVAAVRQEAIGIDQVTLAMSEISKVSAQFVSSAQQSKASSAELRKVAERLRESVSVYKL